MENICSKLRTAILFLTLSLVFHNGNVTAETIVTVQRCLVNIIPDSAYLYPGDTQAFTASTTCEGGEPSNGTYTWDIMTQGCIGSTIFHDGLYTAPSNIIASCNDTVRATDTANGNAEGTASVSIEDLSDCMLDIKVSPQQGGTTSPRPGNYFLQGCGGQTVKAIPNTGFKFIRWEWSGGSFFSYENPITIEDSGWIVAVFDRLEDIPPTKLIGKYTCSASPCYNYYCHPDFDIGMVWSVICDNDIYYLTKDWEWLWDCEATSWNIYMPEEGDTVTVVGEVSEATDNQDNPYINIEVEYLLPTKCFVEIICGEDTEETELLRNYRDNILTKFPEGRELIKLYYQWSPAIVKAMENDTEFKEEVKEMINGVLPLLRE